MQSGMSAIVWEKLGDVTVVRFTAPKITDELYARQAGAELRRIAQRMGGKILVDLSNVQFMASVGITELITFNKSVRSLGGHVKICSVSPLLMHVFVSCGIHVVLDIHPTQALALSAFHAGSHAPQGSTV